MLPNAMARRSPCGSHPATTLPEDCRCGNRRTIFPCESRPTGLLGTTTSLSVSESAISSMTPFSTPNRSARMTASAPCNASRLSLAAAAPRPIAAASFRADSVSALERRRVSPPDASRRAMTDPSPPVPMIAVLMTRTRLSSALLGRPVSGRPVPFWVRGLSDFDDVSVGIADVAADLVLVLFGRRQELSATGAPFGIHGRDVLDPDIQEAAHPVGIAWRLQSPRRLVVRRAAPAVDDDPAVGQRDVGQPSGAREGQPPVDYFGVE